MSVSFDGRATVETVLQHLEGHAVTELICRSVFDDTSMQTFHDAVMSHRRWISSLQVLKLPANQLSSGSLPGLSHILQSARMLHHVDLSENHLGDAGNPHGLDLLVDVLNSADSCRVRTLNLQHNRIGPKGSHALSRLLRDNTTLQSLSLAQNALGTRAIKAMAPSLALNSTLRHLDLSYNKLSDRGLSMLVTAIFDTSSVCQLTSLDLQYNKIGPSGAYTLARALLEQHNKYLTRLDLSLNNMGPDGAQALGALLQYSHVLRHLYLGRNDMSLGVLSLLERWADSQVSQLQLLDLSWNSLTDEAVVYLAERILPNNVCLQTLNLASNAIGNPGVLALAKALRSNMHLRDLNIVGNQARDESALALAELLTSQHCHVQTLHWEKNNFSELGKRRLRSAEVFRENCRLWLDRYLEDMKPKKVVAIDVSSRRRMGDDELVAICRVLAKHRPRVPTFWIFGGNGKASYRPGDSDEDDSDGALITGRGIVVLGREVLAPNAGQVERLYLDECRTIEKNGWLALAQALATNRTIVTLSLTRSNLDTATLSPVLEALQRQRTLERLNLSDNQLGDSIFPKLSPLIQSKERPLKSLNLSRNHVSDQGLAWLPALTGNCTLQELHLAGNKITDAGALDLAKACLPNRTLQWVNLSHNHLSYKGKRALKLFLPESAILEADGPPLPEN